MTFYILPVVEGQTEQGCVERLLHLIWAKLLNRPERLQVVEPFRGRRDQLVHPNGVVLADTVQKAFHKLRAKTRNDTEAQSLVLILLDAESDCPATLDPLPARDQFEDCSGAAWLEAQLRSLDWARKYKKTVDAELFVQQMNLEECRTNSPSFDKLCRELEAHSQPGPAAEPDEGSEEDNLPDPAA